MVDSKTVISQVQEFQLVLHGIEVEGMILPETFHVTTIVEKLPPAWRDFKNYLKLRINSIRIASIQMLIVIASFYNVDIHKIDVKTALLNGNLNEEIYME